MSNRLLKKFVEDLSSCPLDELQKLVLKAINEEDILLSLFDSLDDAHLIINDLNIIIFSNSKAKVLIPYGRNSKSLEGQHIEKCFIDDDVKAYISSVIHGSDICQEKDFSIQRGGEVHYYRVGFKRLICDEKNYVDGYIKEITDAIKKETRLRRSESLASMTTMAAGVAHEIKNPLAAMAIHTQLLRKCFHKYGSGNSQLIDKYLSIIEEEIDHLNKIAVDFLFAVKPLEVELKKDDINSIISDVISFLEPEAIEKKITLSVSLSSFLPTIMLDSHLVKQVFLNLFQNAFAAMPNGGTLTVKSKINGDYVSVYISDNGIGIEKDKLSKIFEPYYTTKANGTGLGLTLVYKIIKEHNGEIHVSSTPNKGTTFVLDFPIPISERKAIEEKK